MENRFIISQKIRIGFSEQAKIIVDTETGVQYLLTVSGYAGGLTALVDKDGKPLLDERFVK